MAHRKPMFLTGDEYFAWTVRSLCNIGKLTDAEERVCAQLILGRRYADIAMIESVSCETVRWHVKRILRKVDAVSTREFILAIGRDLDENGPR